MDRNIGVVLSANATSFKTQMGIASGAVKDFENQTDKTSSNAGKAFTAIKLAAAAVGVALAAAFASAVMQASAFDASMRNVNTIAKMSEEQFASTSAQVLQLSTELPQSAKVLADGLYDIASSGFQGAEGMQILEVSAKAASAGLTDTAVASKAVVAVLNAYGLSADDAAHVSDVLFQAVNVGVISFEELASQLGDVVGLAAAAGVSIEEVSAATAAMTLSGISAAESTTSLGRVLQGIIDPSAELKTLLKGLGYESGKTALDALGLHGVMELLRGSTGGEVEALLALFPEIRGARGAFALMAADGANYTKAFDAITDKTQVAGATQAAFTEQMKGLGVQFELFKNRVNAGLITIGTKAIPYLIDSLGALQTFGETVIDLAVQAGDALSDFFTSIKEAGQNVISIAGKLVSSLKPVAVALAALSAVGVAAALTAVAQALSFATGFVDKFYGALFVLGTYLTSRWLLALGTSAISAFSTAMKGLQSIAAGTSITFSGLGSALLSPSVALTGVALVAAGAVQAFQNADAAAARLAETFTSKMKPNDVSSYEKALSGLTTELQKQQKVAEEYDSATGVLKAFGEVLNPFVANRGLDAATAVDTLGASVEETKQRIMTFNASMVEVVQHIIAAGVETEFFASLPKADGILTPQAVSDLQFYNTQVKDLILSTAAAQNIDLSLIEAGDKDAIDQVATAVENVIAAAKNGTVQTDALTQSFSELSDQTANSTDRLKAYKDALDAIFGPTLSEFEAATKFGGALDSLTTAVEKNGITLLASTEGGRANRDALAGAAQAALDHAEAVANQSNSLAAGTEVLKEHVIKIQEFLEALGLSPAAAKEFTDAAGLTEEHLAMIASSSEEAKSKLDEVTAGIKGVPSSKEATITANTAPARDALSNLEARISQQRSMNVRADADTAQAESDLEVLTRDRTVRVSVGGGRYLERWGGIVQSYASGGIRGARIAQTPQVSWAEPATGGEAYIPKNGDSARSLAILATAADWYGQRMSPKGGMGGGGGGIVVAPQMTVSVTASTASDQKMLEATVRRAVVPAMNDLTRQITRELQTRR